MIFNAELLDALGSWQCGWREDQSHKDELAEKLKEATKDLPEQFRTVDKTCYRKRFLHKGELVDIVMGNCKSEGVASWTTDQAYAERFKGIVRNTAVSAAIFEHTPSPSEVIVNIPELWKCKEFETAVDEFSKNDSDSSKALLNFKYFQNEVVLEVPLKGSDIIGLSGVSSPFDELCDTANIKESDRDLYFKRLIDSGAQPETPMLLSREGAQRAINNSIQTMWNRINEIKNS